MSHAAPTTVTREAELTRTIGVGSGTVVRHRWTARTEYGRGPERMTRKSAFADAKRWMDRKKNRPVKWVVIERHDVIYETVPNESKLSHAASATPPANAELKATIGVGSGALLGGTVEYLAKRFGWTEEYTRDSLTALDPLAQPNKHDDHPL